MTRTRQDADPAFDPTPDQPLGLPSAPPSSVEALALAIAWSRTEPERVGECCFVPAEPVIIGRGGRRPEDDAPRAVFTPLRPGAAEPGPPLTGPNLSRAHAHLQLVGDSIHFLRSGKGTTELDGLAMNKGALTPGATLLLANELLLVCDRRSSLIPEAPLTRPTDFRFGHADGLGMAGETPTTWRLRDQVRFAAGSSAPLLVCGPPGAGKDVIARAVHRASAWRERPFVLLGGATLNAAQLDQLQARSDAPFVLIDELSDVSAEVQALLARLLALTNGLPLPRMRIVATNTSPGNEAIRAELASRLIVTIRVPGLDERRADVPLIARALLRELARDQPEIGARFFSDWSPEGAGGEPRLSPALVDKLLRHRWHSHVRELTALLWTAMTTASEAWLDATPEVVTQLEAAETVYSDPGTLDAETVQEALDAANGKVAVAARALKLKNRWVLYRLMEKLDIRS